MVLPDEVKNRAQSHSGGYTKNQEICPKLLKAPFVCNGCEKKSRSSCPYVRRLYSAKYAQNDYRDILVESRTGIPLNKESFYKTEKIISDAIKQGQHVYHAIKANDLPVSTATVYRHIKKSYYSAKPIDLPRAVKFKPRRSRQSEYVPAQAKKGRTHADFFEFTAQNQTVPVMHKSVAFISRSA